LVPRRNSNSTRGRSSFLLEEGRVHRDQHASLRQLRYTIGLSPKGSSKSALFYYEEIKLAGGDTSNSKGGKKVSGEKWSIAGKIAQTMKRSG